MPWTGDLQAVLGAHEVAPAQMVGDRVAQAGADPRSRIPTGPVLVVCRRRGHGLPQLLLQRGRHGRWGAMRCGVPAIVHARRSLGVVALGDLADPVRRVAGDRGHRNGRMTLAEQPEDLPPRALARLFGRSIAALELVDTQMGLEVDVSGHTPIVQPPSSKPYDLLIIERPDQVVDVGGRPHAQPFP